MSDQIKRVSYQPSGERLKKCKPNWDRVHIPTQYIMKLEKEVSRLRAENKKLLEVLKTTKDALEGLSTRGLSPVLIDVLNQFYHEAARALATVAKNATDEPQEDEDDEHFGVMDEHLR